MKKRFKKIAIAVAAVAAICVGGIALYANDYYRADETVALTMQQAELPQSNISMETTDGMVIFRPKEIKAGFIFYPGGKVEHTAYVPLVYQLAQNGVACIITEMPLNLAVMDMDAADKAYERIANVDRWYIGGHSLGGSMAAGYLEKAENNFEGLILLAAYSTSDLSAKDINVLSVYGTEDKVLNMEKYTEYFANLPENTTELVIEGGNHAQFGCYGNQEGDGQAQVDAEQQRNITVDAILEFMGI